MFLHTTLAQLALAYPTRRFAGRPLRNPTLHLNIGLAAALQLAALLVPGLRAALGVVPIEPALWLGVGASVGLSWAAAECARWYACRLRAGTSHALEHQPGGR